LQAATPVIVRKGSSFDRLLFGTGRKDGN